MKAKRTHDVVATVGTYRDQSGKEKKRYQNCGSAFTDEEGRVAIKLDAVPCSPDWSGWLSLYPIKEREQTPTHGGPAKEAAGDVPGEEDGDIPF